MSFLEIEFRQDGVEVIRLARPPVNALNGAFLTELATVFDDIHARDDVRALVLWGGDSVFAAGADVEEFQPISAETGRKLSEGLRPALDSLASLPRPTIAAITGYALGGGLELALACDFRVAGNNARLGFPEIQLGVIPGAGGTQRAVRLIGPARAKDLIFSGRHARAEEALAIGLVDRVVDPDQVHSEALEWAGALGRGAVAAMGSAKRAIDGGIGLPLADGLALETDCFAEVMETEDAKTGIESFLETGPGKAQFSGK